MFLVGFGVAVGGVSFPRIRGDVPNIGILLDRSRLFSPHTRGCSADEQALLNKFDVFPAYAGMFRCRTGCGCMRLGFPRIRGDVPLLLEILRFCLKFSPHTRGCSV